MAESLQVMLTTLAEELKQTQEILFPFLFLQYINSLLFFNFFYCSSSTVVSTSPPRTLPYPSHPYSPPLILPALVLSMCPL